MEDNSKNLELFKIVLNSLPNLEILTSTRGKDGLRLIKSKSPDIIILDIQLPDINGIEICKELRKIEKFKEKPIVAITSFAMKGDKNFILESGFTDYIGKPIIIQEFRKKINGYLE
ncbi:MAG: response regulator [Promethearchaeota archaeon]